MNYKPYLLKEEPNAASTDAGRSSMHARRWNAAFCAWSIAVACALHANAVHVTSSDSSARSIGTARVTSEKSCAELGWTGSEAFGSARVCGASDAYPLAGCTEFASWTAAREACEAPGARLCSLDELSFDEARGTGCGFDDARVWSATPCGEDAYFAQRGATTGGDEAESSRAGRCAPCGAARTRTRGGG